MPDDLKKKCESSILTGIVQPYSLEFETSLSPQECAERLKKLAMPRVYLAAKGRAGMANQGFVTEVVQQGDAYNFTIELYDKLSEGEVIISGEIFSLEMNETTIVRINPSSGNSTSSIMFLGIVLLTIIGSIFIFLTASTSNLGTQSLCVAFMFFLSAIFYLGIRSSKRRDFTRLVEDVLTKSNEDEL